MLSRCVMLFTGRSEHGEGIFEEKENEPGIAIHITLATQKAEKERWKMSELKASQAAPAL